MYQKYFKRLIDIILSLLLVVFLSPLYILVFFFVWIFIGKPIFSQERPGLNGKIFIIYKFRTLNNKSHYGKFLRSTGIDELPQLFNVLKNDMSLIGPRPLLKEYLKYYSANEKKRHLVKPGITGLAQINPQKNGMKSWKKSLKYDLFYIKKLSFCLDCKVLLGTVKVIITQKKLYNDFKKSFNNKS